MIHYSVPLTFFMKNNILKLDWVTLNTSRFLRFLYIDNIFMLNIFWLACHHFLCEYSSAKSKPNSYCINKTEDGNRLWMTRAFRVYKKKNVYEEQKSLYDEMQKNVKPNHIIRIILYQYLMQYFLWITIRRNDCANKCRFIANFSLSTKTHSSVHNYVVFLVLLRAKLFITQWKMKIFKHFKNLDKSLDNEDSNFPDQTLKKFCMCFMNRFWIFNFWILLYIKNEKKFCCQINQWRSFWYHLNKDTN